MRFRIRLISVHKDLGLAEKFIALLYIYGCTIWLYRQ